MNKHSGHRERFDKKVMNQGLENLEEHEQLEYILYAVIPRKNTNDLAHDLIDRFGSIAGVLNARPEELLEVEGVGPRCAKFISTLPDILGIVERNMRENPRKKLDTFDKIKEFARSYFYGKLNEEVYIISLDSSYKLLGITQIADGIGDEAHVYSVKALRQAIRDNASTAIVVHNHPCGILSPSHSDFTLTAKLAIAFRAADMELYDSIIVSGGECFSMDQNYTLEKIVKTYLQEGR